MVLEVLPPDSYMRLQGLCAPFDMHLAVTAILASETPAQIYVDDLNNPSIALFFPWNRHRVFLAGETDDELLIREIRQLFFSIFSLDSSEAILHEFIIYYNSPSWEMHFQSLCEGMETIAAKRHYYVLSRIFPNWQAAASKMWGLRTIDETLVAAQNLQYLSQLIEEIHSESPSVEDFLARKFGYCLQEDSTLIGWCLSEYNHADRCEVGIETVTEYRNRGVAFTTASALISHALANGITKIGWHCWGNNISSNALALKLGGVLTAEYPARLCRFRR